MRGRLIAITLAAGVAAALNPSAQANLISNSDFSNGSTGWSLNTRSEPTNVTEVIAAAQSPFTTGGTALGLHVKEPGGVSNPPLASQNLSALQNGGLSVSFDFCVTSASTYASTDGAFIFRIFDDTGKSAFVQFKGNGTMNDGASTAYTKGTWYHVELTVPSISTLTASSQATMVLTPQNGTGTTLNVAWTNASFTNTAASYKTIQLQPAFGGLSTGSTDDFYVDNLNVDPVPEPAAVGLLGVGLMMGLARHRTPSPR